MHIGTQHVGSAQDLTTKASSQAIAEQYMPKLEVASGMELDVEDVNGKQYTLKFR